MSWKREEKEEEKNFNKFKLSRKKKAKKNRSKGNKRKMTYFKFIASKRFSNEQLIIKKNIYKTHIIPIQRIKKYFLNKFNTIKKKIKRDHNIKV